MTPHEPRPRADAVTVPPRSSSCVYALPLIALACSFAACGRIPGQFEIVQNQAPHPGCVIDTSPTVYRGDGTLDLSLVQSGSDSAYFVFPLCRTIFPARRAARTRTGSRCTALPSTSVHRRTGRCPTA